VRSYLSVAYIGYGSQAIHRHDEVIQNVPANDHFICTSSTYDFDTINGHGTNMQPHGIHQDGMP